VGEAPPPPGRQRSGSERLVSPGGGRREQDTQSARSQSLREPGCAHSSKHRQGRRRFPLQERGRPRLGDQRAIGGGGLRAPFTCPGATPSSSNLGSPARAWAKVALDSSANTEVSQASRLRLGITTVPSAMGRAPPESGRLIPPGTCALSQVRNRLQPLAGTAKYWEVVAGRDGHLQLGVRTRPRTYHRLSAGTGPTGQGRSFSAVTARPAPRSAPGGPKAGSAVPAPAGPGRSTPARHQVRPTVFQAFFQRVEDSCKGFGIDARGFPPTPNALGC